MNLFSKIGVKKEIEKMKAERDSLVKTATGMDIQFKQLRQELGQISIQIEAKSVAINDLELRFGFVKPPKEPKPPKEKEK